MSHPIFFSVASNDISTAEKIFDRYASDLIYLYSRNGKNGTWMWQEIEEEELPFSRAFVIFWSKAYLSNTGTRRELAQARRMLENRTLREFLIIRCDDTPLFAQYFEDLDAESLQVFEDLRPFLRHVRADAPRSVEHVNHLIDELVLKVDRPSAPLQPRPILQEDLKAAARISRFSYHPAVWLSGLNGYGRKTLIREFMREVDPNLVPVIVDIDETSLPSQIHARIRIIALDEALSDIEQLGDESVSSIDVAQVIESVAKSGRYLLLRQARVFEEASQLPTWLEEVFAGLEAGNSPKVFIVAQIPVDDKAVARLPDKIAAFRMRSMEPGASEELVWKLIGALDSNPDRWTDIHVDDIIRHCGGTPELMVAIIKIASKLNDLTALSEIIGTQAAQFSDTLASLASWAFGQLDGYDDEKRALLFLNDVSPVALQDIESFLHSNRSVSEIVGRLVSLGLVEQSEDGLLRLSPLLSRRLSSLLTTRDLVGWHRTAISEFANQPFDISDGEMGYIRVEARIKAELYSGKIEISPDLKRFVSHAHYFQIGVRLYNARRYGDAFRILKAAFAHRSVFDLNAGIELARFYCLSSIRLRNRESDVQAALMFLRSRHQGQSMADFLEGERLRFYQRFDESLKFFEKAQKAARDNKERYREERIIRPYLESILSSRYPNFVKAKSLSDRGVQLAKTFYSLAMRARVYLRIWQEAHQSEADAAEIAYRKVLLELQDQPGASSFYAQARSEEAEAFAIFDDAIDWMKVAIEGNSRAELRLRLWSLQIRSSSQEERSHVLKDIEQFCADAANRSDVSGLANAIAQRYARALNAQGELKQFRISQLNMPLSEGEVRKIFLQEKDRARQH